MVNLKRCENGYLNAVVYGCATDGHFFTFLRMNSDLKVWLFAIVSISVHWPGYHIQYTTWYQRWDLRTFSYLHRSERRIYTQLRRIIRMAIVPSSRSLPIRDRDDQQSTMSPQLEWGQIWNGIRSADSSYLEYEVRSSRGRVRFAWSCIDDRVSIILFFYLETCYRDGGDHQARCRTYMGKPFYPVLGTPILLRRLSTPLAVRTSTRIVHGITSDGVYLGGRRWIYSLPLY